MNNCRNGNKRNRWKHNVNRIRDKQTQKYKRKQYDSKKSNIISKDKYICSVLSALQQQSKRKAEKQITIKIPNKVYGEFEWGSIARAYTLTYNAENRLLLADINNIDHHIHTISIHRRTTVDKLIQNLCTELNAKSYEFDVLCIQSNHNKTKLKKKYLSSIKKSEMLITNGITPKSIFELEWKTTNIYIKTPKETVKLTAKFNDRLHSIMLKYSDHLKNISYKLLYDNNCILDMKTADYYSIYDTLHRITLNELEIPPNATLHFECKLEITIPNESTPFTLEIDRNTCIIDLKYEICQKMNVETYAFCLRVRPWRRWHRYWSGIDIVRGFYDENHEIHMFDYTPSDSCNVFDILSTKPDWKWELEWASTNVSIQQQLSIEKYKGMHDISTNYNENIHEIKSKYRAALELPDRTKFRLLYDGMILQENKTIHDYGIPPNAKLIALYQLIINVTDTQQLLIDTEPLITVDELKHEIAVELSISVRKIRLYRPDREIFLEDNGYKLHDIDINDLDQLYMISDNHDDSEQIPEQMTKNNIPNHAVITIRVKQLGHDESYLELINIKQNDTIHSIKLTIQNKKRIYHSVQMLIYKGCELNDSLTMRRLNIDQYATFYIIIKTDICSAIHELLIDGFISEMVNKTDDEYCYIQRLFIDTKQHWWVTLKNIYKINKNAKQNNTIFEALLSTKSNKNEEMLFHGTSFDKIIKIIESGFNRDYNKRSAYGRGTYFSNRSGIAAGYCSKYENVYAMLCCRTYIGDYKIGTYSMENSDLYKSDKITQYDSLVNDMYNPTIFVINRDYHSIPYYLIVFT